MNLTEEQRDALTLLATGAKCYTAARVVGSSETSLHRFLTRLKRETRTRTTTELIAYLIVSGDLPLTVHDFVGEVAK